MTIAITDDLINVKSFNSFMMCSKRYDEAYLKRAIEKVPLKRLGVSEDIAGLTCFLAMPASS